MVEVKHVRNTENLMEKNQKLLIMSSHDEITTIFKGVKYASMMRYN